MMHRKRHGPLPFSHGFSLLEVSISLAVVALVLSALLPLGWRILASAREAQMRSNLQAIGRACQQYYLNSGNQQKWPSKISDLQPFFLSPNIDGTMYTLKTVDPGANVLKVSTATYSETVVKPYN